MSKFYVVWKGRRPGVYATWNEAKAQVDGFPGVQFASAKNETLARAAFAGSYQDFVGGKATRANLPRDVLAGYVSDAACSRNPGPVEWRCVKIDSGKELFRKGPFEDGTNNIGEFLGIVDSLIMLKSDGSRASLFSDSEKAIEWVQAKRARTKLVRTTKNAPLFELIEQAEAWLRENDYATPVLKWDTETWGENPADFGRK